MINRTPKINFAKSLRLIRWLTMLPSQTDTPTAGNDAKTKLQTFTVHNPEIACPARIKKLVKKIIAL